MAGLTTNIDRFPGEKHSSDFEVFDETSCSAVDDHTWERLKDASVKDGFREGATDGKEHVLQDTFNEGYLRGFELSCSMYYFMGLLSAAQSIVESGKIQTESSKLSKINQLKAKIIQVHEKMKNSVVTQGAESQDTVSMINCSEFEQFRSACLQILQEIGLKDSSI